MTSKEQYWHFTFGHGQRHFPGYAKFYGTYGSARDRMVQWHGDKWSFQYDEKKGKEIVEEWKLKEVK